MINEVNNFKSLDCKPALREATIINWYNTAPITGVIKDEKIVNLPQTNSPIIIEARAITIIPIPIPTSEKPWYCANRAPEIAIREFPKAKPIIFKFSSFIPKEVISVSLSPNARKRNPNFVLKKKVKSKINNVMKHTKNIRLKYSFSEKEKICSTLKK